MNDVSQNSPYAAPQAELGGGTTESRRYAGFWIRVLASIIDSIIMLIITGPLLYAFYGTEAFLSEELVQGTAHVIISYIFPLVFTITLWVTYGGTPGKRMLGLKVIDQITGENLSVGKSLIRYIGYLVSTIILMIGFIMVAFTQKKQGLHDLMAGSIVVIE